MKGHDVADLPRFRPPCSAAEERELRAIALEVLSEALVLGKAASGFRGHRIRVDCWFTDRGFVVRCAFDGQVICGVGAPTLWINDLPAIIWSGDAVSARAQHEPQFVLQEHSSRAW